MDACSCHGVLEFEEMKLREHSESASCELSGIVHQGTFKDDHDYKTVSDHELIEACRFSSVL